MKGAQEVRDLVRLLGSRSVHRNHLPPTACLLQVVLSSIPLIRSGCQLMKYLSQTVRLLNPSLYAFDDLLAVGDRDEQAVEEQITRIRVQMLEQVVADGPKQDRPVCRECGTTMVPRSEAERQLTVQGDEAVHLARSYAVCPSCGAGLFPPG